MLAAPLPESRELRDKRATYTASSSSCVVPNKTRRAVPYPMKSRIFTALVFGAALCRGASSAPPDDLLPLAPGGIEVVPSFAAGSYYFRPPSEAARSFVVEFRRTGTAEWRRGFDPVSDLPAGIWKGSVFDLAEDTAWQMRVRAADGAEMIPAVDFKTWSSQPPIARVVDLRRWRERAGAW